MEGYRRGSLVQRKRAPGTRLHSSTAFGGTLIWTAGRLRAAIPEGASGILVNKDHARGLCVRTCVHRGILTKIGAASRLGCDAQVMSSGGLAERRSFW